MFEIFSGPLAQNDRSFAQASTRWYNVPVDAKHPQEMAAEHRSAPLRDKSGPMRVLIVDDDRPSLKMTAFLLREEGYTVFTADNGQEALRLVDEKTPDLLVLDVMMPGIDGLEVTRRLRRNSSLPIIILSAKGETSDRVSGLDVGADDYLAKPFEPSELLARVRSVLRRAEAFTFGEPQNQLSVGGFRMDPVNNTVTVPDGRVIELTPIEFRLLHYLVRNNGRVLTHEQLLNTVWGYDYEGYSNQVAVYIRRLRTKLEPDPDNPRYLITTRGIGYKFEAGA
jgi:DNA-binding response OmpR family regulator